jgi:hypothetical protein
MISINSAANAVSPGLSAGWRTDPRAGAQVPPTTASSTVAASALAVLRQSTQQPAGPAPTLTIRAGDLAKQAAQQRLAQLAAELKTLLLVASDPKARAEAAARLAKEIGQAVQDYEAGVKADAADASAGDGSVPSSPADAVGASSAQATAAQATAAAQAPTNDAAAPTPANAPTAAADSAAASPPTTSLSPDTTAAAVATPTSPPTPAEIAAADRAGLRAELAPSVAPNADQTFIRQARDMLRKTGFILKLAIEEARLAREKPKVTGAEVDDAMKDVNGLSAVLAPPSAGYDAAAQPATSATPAPAVSVTA